MTRATKCFCLLMIAGLCACGCDDSSDHQAAPTPPVEHVAPPSPVADPEPPSPDAAKPAKPADPNRAETTPASTPASAATQPENTDLFQPLADAKVGEWAVYEALNSQTLQYRITDVGMTRVKTEVRATLDERLLGMPAEREDLRTADPLAWETPADGRRQTSRTTIRAAGRDWDAVLYEDQWTDEGVKYVRRTWASPAAPIFGIIRMELTGDNAVEARLELTEAGQTE